MSSELRKTGISIVGDVPWGTHFCHFYETKQDLLDTLVPYFKTGLESNEFCLWIVSDTDLITVEEAKRALAQVVPDLDRQLSNGNIEILSGHQWYFEKNALNLERVRSAWDAQLKRALRRGYDGLRVSGDTFWLGHKDWKDFCAYEKQINDSIAGRRITILCTYPLAKCGAAEVLDVMNVHQLATARRQGEWQAIQSPESIQAKAELRRLSEELQRIARKTPEPPFILRYGVAVLAVIVALTINWLLNINLVGAPAMLFLCALMFGAWYGGAKPSLLALPLAVLGFAYYFVTPINSWTIDVREIPRLSLFVLASLFVIGLSAAQKRAAESLRQARDVLAGTVEELKRTNQSLRTENTERKQAEARLHAKEQEFRAIVENAPDQIIRYDREFRRTYVNPAVTIAYGLPAEALIDKPIGSIVEDAQLDVTDREVEQVRRRIADVFATGKSYEYEMNWPLPTGRTYFSVRLFPELDTAGSVINVLGISRDITESKRAEEELKREKEVLEKIFDNIPVMIGFVSEDGLVKLVNPEWERSLGWTLKELQEQNVDIFVEAYPDPSYRQEVLDFVAASTGEWVDLKIKVRDGRVIDAACAIVRLSDGTRVAIARDVTESKHAEETLKRSETQLAEAQRLAHVGSWDLDLRANTLTWSDELYRIFGLQPGTIKVSGDAASFVHPDDRDLVWNTLERTIANKKPYSFHYRILRPDGVERIVHSRGSVVSDDRGEAIRVYGVTQDVTELKRAEDRLNETTEQLRALSARLQSAREEESKRIAREIHDELGGALTSWKWDLEEIREGISEPLGAAQVSALQTKIDGMMSLTETTLDTVRKLASELRPMALELGLIEAIEWEATQFENRTGIAVRRECSVDKVNLNHEQSTAVFRIFQEALTNVLRHAQATKVHITVKEEPGQFFLTIRDDGRGILETEESGKQSLGLLGMRERAHLVGGEISIEGIEGDGTRISVQIPISTS